jgi:ABC-type sugar transport system ATPase subunit
MLLDPTSGLDVGAKADVYSLLHKLAGSGTAVVVVSSEIPEVLGLSHRILVMREGQVVAEFPRGSAREDAVLAAAIGEGRDE